MQFASIAMDDVFEYWGRQIDLPCSDSSSSDSEDGDDFVHANDDDDADDDDDTDDDDDIDDDDDADDDDNVDDDDADDDHDDDNDEDGLYQRFVNQLKIGIHVHTVY